MENSRENFKALLFAVCFPLTVVSVSVSLYPSESIVAPLESTVFINCSFNLSSQNTFLYWNISHELLRLTPSPDRGINISTDAALIGVSKLSVALRPVNADLDIQCQLCDACTTNSPAQDFTASTDPLQVNAFGPPSSLSHELRENDTVKLSWLPPVVEAVPLFTYNIIIMESTDNSLTVTDINITNNTYVIISPANITNYTECTSYQWGVRAAANLSYGFTNVTIPIYTFTLISGPKISDELVVIDDNYTIEFNVTTPCNIDLLNNYTYTLLHRDYCQTELNSTQLNISIDDNVLPNTMILISVSIGSLIHDLTWSVAVNVSNRFGFDTTDYTNITGRSSSQCYSESIPTSSSMISVFITRSRSNTVQTLSVTATTVYSTVYNTVTVTPSTNVTVTVTPSAPNVIPIVIGAAITVMILLIVVITLLLIFIVLICCKRTTEMHQDGHTNAVELETCPAYGDISIVQAENNEAYNKRDEFGITERNYETLN